MKDNIFLFTIVMIASFAGLLSGYDTGVISGALLYINKTFNLTYTQSGLIVSFVSFGAIIGAFINGLLIDKIGRKKVLIFAGFIFLLASILCFLSQNVHQLIVARGLIGVGVGIVSFCTPLYLSEISSKEKRGATVSFYQLAITFGILFSYLINYTFSYSSLNWRLMLGFGCIPSIILFLGMLFLPDTPRFYVLAGFTDKAKSLLSKIRPAENIETEIQGIKDTIQNAGKITLKSIKSDFKKLTMPFVIGIGIMFAQIATGINAIIYYAPTIFKSVGFDSNHSVLFITIFIGLINFLMTFVAILTVDKLGRKPLLYIGLTGMLVSLFVLSSVFIFDYSFVKYLAVIFTGLYIVSFSMSLGPVALLIISEVFPLKYRGFAMSISIVANFVFNFTVTLLFPIFLHKIGGCQTFLIFALICIISILFVKFVVPETKGISLEEIEAKFKNQA